MKPIPYRTALHIVKLGNAVTWMRNERMKKIDITSSQSEVIRYILKHKNENITACNLMKHLSLSQSTIAGIIKRLEAKSLVIRKKSEKDTRKIIIIPTEQGLKLDHYLKETARQTEDVLLKGMTDDEQREFNRLLEIALSNVKGFKNSSAATPDE